MTIDDGMTIFQYCKLILDDMSTYIMEKEKIDFDTLKLKSTEIAREQSNR